MSDLTDVAKSGCIRPVTVVLGDSCHATRQELASLLVQQEDIQVVAEATQVSSLNEAIQQYQPDVVAVDVCLRTTAASSKPLELVRQACGQTRMVLISPWNHPLYVARFLQAGACGYLLKTNAYDELVPAIRVAILGGVFLSPELRDPARYSKALHWSGASTKGFGPISYR